MENRASSHDSRGCGRRPPARLAVLVPLLLFLVLPAGAPAAWAKPGPASDFDSKLAANYLAGLHAEHTQDYASASEFFARVFAADPDNRELGDRSLMLHVSAGHFDRALDAAQRLRALDHSHALANMFLAMNAARGGHFTDAVRFLEEIPVKGLDRYTRPLFMAWAQVGQGKPDLAIKTLARLSHSRAFALFDDLHAGFIHDLEGNAAAAENRYRAAYGASPEPSLRLAAALASFYARQGRIVEAREIYREFQDTREGSALVASLTGDLDEGRAMPPMVGAPAEGLAEAALNFAHALESENANTLALLYVRFALFLKPEFPEAKLLVGDILRDQGRYEDAVRLYGEVSTLSPYGREARIRKAEALHRLGRSKDAAKLLRQLIDERADYLAALTTLGDILRDSEKFDEAVAVYDKAVAAVQPVEKHHWGLLYARGIALERAKEWRRAETDFLRALELEPDQPFILNYLAYSWVEQGINLPRARSMIERAVRRRPNDGYIVDSLGWVLYHLGDYERAAESLERAAELVPHDSTINDHLGDAYWRVGRRLEARFQWSRALLFDPTEELLASITRKLEHGLTDPARSEAHSNSAAGAGESAVP